MTSLLHSLTTQTKSPILIAGPCSAESESQLLETARQLSKIDKVKIFRAGIWKPRTSPNSFEGVGEIGLKWLEKVKSETGLLISTEIANPQHIELSLKHNIDILWIGARTVVNPFSMQEIAEALKGVKNPIMVKNPMHPEIKLWTGAFERLAKNGVNNIAAIHRGFFSIEKKMYRYEPYWEVPIELMRLMPELPIFCDPSHIAGNKILISSIAQHAIDLEMNGLMIEVHNKPIQALTDAKQQITPSELNEILNNLIIRDKNIKHKKSINALRTEIDLIDTELIKALSKRMEISKELGKYKLKHKMTILQLERWKDLYVNRVQLAEDMGLSKAFITKILKTLHHESINIQNNIMNQKEKK